MNYVEIYDGYGIVSDRKRTIWEGEINMEETINVLRFCKEWYLKITISPADEDEEEHGYNYVNNIRKTCLIEMQKNYLEQKSYLTKEGYKKLVKNIIETIQSEEKINMNKLNEDKLPF